MQTELARRKSGVDGGCFMRGKVCVREGDGTDRVSRAVARAAEEGGYKRG